MNTVLKDMVSNELVTYQNNSRLKNIITEFVSYGKTQLNFTAYNLNSTELPKLIEKQLGSELVFYSCDGTYFATILPDIKRNATIFPDHYHELLNEKDLRKLKETCENLEGSLDFKNGKIGGIFNEFKIPIIIGDDTWNPNFIMTAEEITAAILHEIGHHFTYFMYLAETMKTNIVLNSLNRSSYFNSDKKVRIKILDEIEDLLKIKLKDKDTLSVNDKNILFTVLLSEVTKKPRSDTGSSIYDARTREFLADQYVVMNGAGKDLATGMAKLFKVSGEATFDIEDRMKVNILKYITIVAANFGPQLFLTWAIFTASVGDIEDSYDNPKLRLIKMKEQLVSILKDRDLNIEIKREIIDDINTVDSLIDRMTEHQNYVFFIVKNILPWARKRESISKLQHDYESLAYNDFYKLSAKMSV